MPPRTPPPPPPPPLRMSMRCAVGEFSPSPFSFMALEPLLIVVSMMRLLFTCGVRLRADLISLFGPTGPTGTMFFWWCTAMADTWPLIGSSSRGDSMVPIWCP